MQTPFGNTSTQFSSTNADNKEEQDDETYAQQQLQSEAYREVLQECVRFPIKVQRFLSLISEEDLRLYNVGSGKKRTER